MQRGGGQYNARFGVRGAYLVLCLHRSRAQSAAHRPRLQHAQRETDAQNIEKRGGEEERRRGEEGECGAHSPEEGVYVSAKEEEQRQPDRTEPLLLREV